MEIEPLLNEIDALSAHFGRVTVDLQAIAARGRAEDFRGVMQNTRLVLEAILRDMVTRELKQTPGKAMLDELISKFRQSTNAGIIPTNILAHMGTVQAWGNLSSHDHAGSLSDEGVKVGKQEVIASLNSMVAILGWYAGRLGVDPTLVRPPTRPPPPVPTEPPQRPVASTPAPVPPPVSRPSSRRAGLALGALGLAVILGGAYWVMSRPPASITVVDPFAQLDADYRSRGEPVPPGPCRRADEASALASALTDVARLEKLHGAEADYLLARARYEAGQPTGPELDRAAACSGFAAALSLQGKALVRQAQGEEKRAVPDSAVALYGRAARSFDAAIAASPTFNNARFNRALLLLKLNKVDDGTRDLREVVAASPSFAEAHFYLGVALEARGEKEAAKEQFCAALKLGMALAKSRCE